MLRLLPIKAWLAVGSVVVLLGAVVALRHDAARAALTEAYNNFTLNRVENIQEDKESDNAVDQLSTDCLADAALNGLSAVDCPTPGD